MWFLLLKQVQLYLSLSLLKTAVSPLVAPATLDEYLLGYTYSTFESWAWEIS